MKKTLFPFCFCFKKTNRLTVRVYVCFTVFLANSNKTSFETIRTLLKTELKCTVLHNNLVWLGLVLLCIPLCTIYSSIFQLYETQINFVSKVHLFGAAHAENLLNLFLLLVFWFVCLNRTWIPFLCVCEFDVRYMWVCMCLCVCVCVSVWVCDANLFCRNVWLSMRHLANIWLMRSKSIWNHLFTLKKRTLLFKMKRSKKKY